MKRIEQTKNISFSVLLFIIVLTTIFISFLTVFTFQFTGNAIRNASDDRQITAVHEFVEYKGKTLDVTFWNNPVAGNITLGSLLSNEDLKIITLNKKVLELNKKLLEANAKVTRLESRVSFLEMYLFSGGVTPRNNSSSSTSGSSYPSSTTTANTSSGGGGSSRSKG